MHTVNHRDYVVCQDVSFAHPTKTILESVNMTIARGKITAILGPSGTGKTTLLKLIGGELVPQHGSIRVDGHDIHAMSRVELLKFRQSLGMLFQTGALFTDLSVFENVAFPLRELTQLPASIIRDIVLMKLEAVGLRGAKQLSPSELSGGMARRVALARAVVLDPLLMMYDEPFAGLDPIAMGVTATLVKQLNYALGMTSILVTHDVAVTMTIADFIYVIANGHIIAGGTPSELTSNPAPEVQQFIRGLPDGVVPFHYPAKAFAEELGVAH